MRPRRDDRPIPNHADAARGYVFRGKSGKQALVDAGYSPKQARKGLIATLQTSAPLRQAFQDELNRWIKVAEILPLPHERANLVRVRLLLNVIQGKDKAVQSAKLLGQDKEVAMWERQQPAGIAVNINSCPSEWLARFLASVEAEH